MPKCCSAEVLTCLRADVLRRRICVRRQRRVADSVMPPHSAIAAAALGALQHISTQHFRHSGTQAPALRHPARQHFSTSGSQPVGPPLASGADMPLLPVVPRPRALRRASCLALIAADCSERVACAGSCRARRRRDRSALCVRGPSWCSPAALAGAWAARDGAGRARRPASPCAAPSGAARPVHAGGVVALSGVLDEDASAGANGVRLRLAVYRFAEQEVDGAETVALTVGGDARRAADGAVARRPRHSRGRDASPSGALPQSRRRATTGWPWRAAA